MFGLRLRWPNTRASGAQAEDLALQHLQSAGLQLIERNWTCKGGEIDLVMRDGATLVLVEVRHRSSADRGDGLDSVGPGKRQRMITAARQYLSAHPALARGACRFDVVASGPGGLRWVRNAVVLDQGW